MICADNVAPHRDPEAKTTARRRVLETVAERIGAQDGAGVRRVGVDGRDGAGKTIFADQLAEVLRARGEVVVRASVDGFHHPRAVRYRRGRDDPLGFFLDSYDYDALRRVLLDPLGPGGDRRIRRAVHDLATDAPAPAPVEVVPDGAVLVVDGIFVHRDELVDVWDLSVLLDTSAEIACARMAARDGGPPDPAHPANRRYVDGQAHYWRRCRPVERATIVVDHDDLDAPAIG